MKMRTGMKRKTNHFPLQVTWKIRRPKRKQKGQERSQGMPTTQFLGLMEGVQRSQALF
jgi:hypothetical protein